MKKPHFTREQIERRKAAFGRSRTVAVAVANARREDPTAINKVAPVAEEKPC